MSGNLSPEARGALTKAGWAWVSFVAGIVAMMLIVFAVVDGGAMHGGLVFAIAALWALIAVPAAVFIKGDVLRAAWSPRPAEPVGYLKGLVLVWGTIEIGAVLALIGCLIDGAVLPGGLLASILLAVLFVLRPSSGALGRGLGTA